MEPTVVNKRSRITNKILVALFIAFLISLVTAICIFLFAVSLANSNANQTATSSTSSQSSTTQDEVNEYAEEFVDVVYKQPYLLKFNSPEELTITHPTEEVAGGPRLDGQKEMIIEFEDGTKINIRVGSLGYASDPIALETINNEDLGQITKVSRAHSQDREAFHYFNYKFVASSGFGAGISDQKTEPSGANGLIITCVPTTDSEKCDYIMESLSITKGEVAAI